MRTEICLLYLTFSTLRSSQNAHNEMRSRLVSASYPDVSLLMKLCAQRKAGRRQRASVPFPWSLVVHHQSLVSRSPLPCEKRSAWGGGWACAQDPTNHYSLSTQARSKCLQFIPLGLQKQSIKHALEKKRVFHRLWGVYLRNEREKVFLNYGKMNLWQSVRVLRSASIAEIELIKCSFC